MAFSEDKFKDHLRKIVSTTTPDDDRPLTLDELKQLAESMGISESEWNDLMLKAEDSLNQALGHLKVQNFTEAIQSAEDATSINPYIKDGNAVLAQAYYKLGYADKNKELLDKAAYYARMELKQDPLDTIALNVLSAVEQINKEGKLSKNLIRIIAAVVGGAVLIFLLLYMCTDSLSEDKLEEVVKENMTPEMQLSQLKQGVKRQESAYTDAIKRRNQDALELVGFIDDQKLRNAFEKSIVDYDFDDITASEQRYRLNLSDVKRNVDISDEMRIRLEGGDNRIGVAKKNYNQAVSSYNTALSDTPVDGYEEIEALK